MRIAITRKVSPAIVECELTHLARAPIDVTRAREQHEAYERRLANLGCEIHSLPAEPKLPDSVFVEDVAVVFDELAIVARPGAESRRPEMSSIMEALQPYRPLHFIAAPATVDGGDVLQVGKRVFVGLSRRTNEAGVEQMRMILSPFGYTVESVPVNGCLHLKSAVTQVADRAVLINPEWVSRQLFTGLEMIEVAPAEPFAANALLIDATVVYGAEHIETRRRLESRGIRVVTVEATEVAKAEGGVTCCSLVFESSRL